MITDNSMPILKSVDELRRFAPPVTEREKELEVLASNLCSQLDLLMKSRQPPQHGTQRKGVNDLCLCRWCNVAVLAGQLERCANEW